MPDTLTKYDQEPDLKDNLKDKEKETARQTGDGVMDNDGAEPLAPGEKASLDQIQAGLKEDGFTYTGSGDKQENKNFRQRALTKKNAAIGAGTSLLVAGGIMGFGAIHGPLQTVHISQLLQQFHFASVEEMSDSRLMKQYKYARFGKNLYSGSVENTRLGLVSARVARNLDAKFAEMGITKIYDENTSGLRGKYNGTEFDTAKYAEHFPEYQNLTDDEFVFKYRQNEGVELRVHAEGRVRSTDTDRIFAYFENPRLNKSLIRVAGFEGTTGWVMSRVFTKRDATSRIWHPIRAVDDWFVGSIDQKFTAWLDNRKEFINGEDGDVTARATGGTDENGDPTAPTPDAEGAAGTVNDEAVKARAAVDPDTPAPATSQGVLARFTGSAPGRLTLSLTAAVGLACTAKSLADGSDALKHDMVIKPLIKTGVEAMALGGQVMSGQDLNMEQLNFMSKQYADEDGKTWASARSIQGELGEPQTGPDIPDEANPAGLKNGTAFSRIINTVPFLGTVCDAASSPIGKGFQIAVSALTPFSSAVGEAAMRSPPVQDALAGVVKWLAGSPIPSYVLGPTYGSYINYGTRIASNNVKAAYGGTELTAAESQTLRADRDQSQREEFESQPFATRMFDIYSPNSLAGRIIDKSSPSVSDNLTNVAGSLLNPGRLAGLFTPRAKAASFNYGFPEIGMSKAKLTSPDFENPFDNSERAINALVGSNGSSYMNRAKQCHGVTLTADGNVIHDQAAVVDPLSSEYGSYNCGDAALEWQSVQMLILDTSVAEGYDCFGNGNQESCDNLGWNLDSETTGGAPGTGTPTGDPNCANAVGNVKIICAIEPWKDIRYSGGNARWNNIWGTNSAVNWLQGGGPAAAWVERNNHDPATAAATGFIECSGYARLSMYLAFGYETSAYCSGAYATDNNNDGFSDADRNLKIVSLNELQPGDFVTVSKSCNSENVSGHIGIFVAWLPNGNMRTLESSAGRNVNREQKSGYYEREPGYFKYAARYVGTGSGLEQ